MTKTYPSLMILCSCLLGGPLLAAETAPAAGGPAMNAAVPVPSGVTSPAAPAAAAQPEAATPAADPAAKSAPAAHAKTGVQDTPLAPAPEASLVDMVRALSQFLTEDEVQMVYDYLWDSSIAALKGSDEEITLPPELAFKLAILQKRIEKEGGHYLQGLSLKMEKDLARWRESLNNPPPPPPYQLPSERGMPKQP